MIKKSSYEEIHLVTQTESDDLVRDLGLTKARAELLGSRLRGWNLLEKHTKITCTRQRQKNFSQFFQDDEKLSYCSNIDEVFTYLGVEHDPSRWHRFIDVLYLVSRWYF